MDELRVGVIGVGWPGQRHIEGYQTHSGVQIVALADKDTDLARRVAADHDLDHGLRIYENYEELLARGDIDAVSICTPNYLHAPMAIDALDAGKHILCEKPLASTVADGERIAARAAASDRIFMMGFNNRFRADSRFLKSRIEDGALGDVYYARTGWLRREFELGDRSWFGKREKSGGGPLIDLGVHVLDLTLWFMGNPRPVSVTGSTYSRLSHHLNTVPGSIDVEDLASALVKVEGGATVILEASWVSFVEHGDYVYSQLFGTEGGAKVERYEGGNNLTIFTRHGNVPVRESPPPEAIRVSGMPPYLPAFIRETAHFVECIKEKREPMSTIRHGLDILRTLDAIYRSAETGKEVHLAGTV